MLLPNDPKEIGGIQILDRLGSGGAGIVYKGRDKDNEIVALKILHAEFANNQTIRKRLEREADAMRSVKGNRTVKIRRIEIDVAQPFIVMDFAEGENLANYIANKGVLKGQALNDFASQLAEAIRDIHKAKVIHRDLKPTNVIIGPDGLKVVDFGISIVSEVTGMTQTGLMVGTVSWLSPEQILGKEITQKTDIFNYGLVLGFAATGKHPFGEGKPEAVMFRILNSDPEIKNIKNEYKIEILKYLEKNPDRRINSLAIFGSKDNLQSISIRQFVPFHKYKKVLFGLITSTILISTVIYFNSGLNKFYGNINNINNEETLAQVKSNELLTPMPALTAESVEVETPSKSETTETIKLNEKSNQKSQKVSAKNSGQICFEKSQENRIIKKCKIIEEKEKFFNISRVESNENLHPYLKVVMTSPWVGLPMCLKKDVRFSTVREINGSRFELSPDVSTVIASSAGGQTNDSCKKEYPPEFLDVTYPVWFDGELDGSQVAILELRSINENPIIIKATWTPSNN